MDDKNMNSHSRSKMSRNRIMLNGIVVLFIIIFSGFALRAIMNPDAYTRDRVIFGIGYFVILVSLSIALIIINKAKRKTFEKEFVERNESETEDPRDFLVAKYAVCLKCGFISINSQKWFECTYCGSSGEEQEHSLNTDRNEAIENAISISGDTREMINSYAPRF
jgi:hypothetical protein